MSIDAPVKDETQCPLSFITIFTSTCCREVMIHVHIMHNTGKTTLFEDKHMCLQFIADEYIRNSSK